MLRQRQLIYGQTRSAQPSLTRLLHDQQSIDFARLDLRSQYRVIQQAAQGQASALLGQIPSRLTSPEIQAQAENIKEHFSPPAIASRLSSIYQTLQDQPVNSLGHASNQALLDFVLEHEPIHLLSYHE